MTMSISSQIFLLFYAVLYGAIFTISERWRPFNVANNPDKGWCRLVLSLIFLAGLPVVYFLLTFEGLLSVSTYNTISLAVAVYAVAPLAAFYFLWGWIVTWGRNTFYSDNERKTEPLKSSLTWIGTGHITFVGASAILLVFLVFPIIAVSLLIWIEK